MEGVGQWHFPAASAAVPAGLLPQELGPGHGQLCSNVFQIGLLQCTLCGFERKSSQQQEGGIRILSPQCSFSCAG